MEPIFWMIHNEEIACGAKVPGPFCWPLFLFGHFQLNRTMVRLVVVEKDNIKTFTDINISIQLRPDRQMEPIFWTIQMKKSFRF